MQNDFEKNIAQRMQQLSISPQPEIWQRVEAALPPQKKRRRIALWWWLLPLTILSGTGFWLIRGRYNVSVVKEKTVLVSKDKIGYQPIAISQNKVPQGPQIITPADTTFQHPFTNKKSTQRKKINIADPAEKEVAPITGELAFTPKSHTVKKVFLSKKIGPTSVIKTIKNIGNTSFQSTNDKSALNDSAAKQVSNDRQNKRQPLKDTMLAGSGYEANADSLPTLASTDSVLLATNKKLVGAPVVDTQKGATDTAAIHQIKDAKTVVAIKRKSTLWMADAGFGLSGLQQQINSSIVRYASPQLSTGAIAGQPANTPSFAPSKRSSSLSLGISRRQTLTPHWNWQLVLRYQLLSTIQSYGSMRNSSASFSLADASRIYYGGDTSKYHNYIHQLQIAPKIEYILNPAAHSSISINAGVSMSYNIRSNQLLYDYRNGYYIQSSANATRWLYAAELGAGITIRKKIYAGLTYQHGLSNVAKPALQSDFRWRVWQVRLGLPLFNHLSK